MRRRRRLAPRALALEALESRLSLSAVAWAAAAAPGGARYADRPTDPPPPPCPLPTTPLPEPTGPAVPAISPKSPTR